MTSGADRGAARGLGSITAIELVPDTAILIQARIKAGEPSLRLKDVANLVLHDPVLTIAFIQHANSVLYAGAPVLEMEAIISRIGIGQLAGTLAQFNNIARFESDRVGDIFEAFRYNCRRTSITALIIATAVNPSLSELARTTGLLCDLGYLVALMRLQEKFCQILEEFGRKNLAYRLEKDHKLDVNAILLRYLRSKGMPEKVLVAYDSEQESRTAQNSQLRFCVQAAVEMIQAYDSGRLETYDAKKELPSRSSLRLMRINKLQHERIYKAIAIYLAQLTKEEAPEAASLFVTSVDEAPDALPEANTITVPVYPVPEVKTKSREQLQELFDICEQQETPESVKTNAMKFLEKSKIFNRGAVVRMEVGKDTATIEYVFGLEYKPGSTIEIKDELSPFNLFRLSIKSTNISGQAPKAPFGVSAFAIGPLAVTAGGDRLLLYADSAQESTLTMEHRRVFRLILGLLARTLQRFEQAAA